MTAVHVFVTAACACGWVDASVYGTCVWVDVGQGGEDYSGYCEDSALFD